MKCKQCGVKIQGKQYTGLGELEDVCPNCAKEIIKSKLPTMKENYKSAINSQRSYEYNAGYKDGFIEGNHHGLEESVKVLEMSARPIQIVVPNDSGSKYIGESSNAPNKNNYITDVETFADYLIENATEAFEHQDRELLIKALKEYKG